MSPAEEREGQPCPPVVVGERGDESGQREEGVSPTLGVFTPRALPPTSGAEDVFPKQRPRGSNQAPALHIIQPYFIPPRLPDGSGASCGTNSPAQPPDVTRGGTGTPKSPVTSVSLRGPPQAGGRSQNPRCPAPGTAAFVRWPWRGGLRADARQVPAAKWFLLQPSGFNRFPILYLSGWNFPGWGPARRGMFDLERMSTARG